MKKLKKKIDKIFLSDYIERCVKSGKCSSSQINDAARSEISEIDRKLAELESLKKLKLKLLDVIYSFDCMENEKILLSFYDLDKELTKIILFKNIMNDSLIKIKRQMVDRKIINDDLTPNINYELYIEFLGE